MAASVPSELDIFIRPPEQLAIMEEIVSDYRPTMVVTSAKTPITFLIQSNGNEMISLADTKLRLRLRFDMVKKANNVTGTDWNNVSLVQLISQSIFKMIEVEINDKPITTGQHNHAYKAYLSTLLGFSRDSRYSYLNAAGWLQQEELTDAPDARKSKWIKPATVNTNGHGKTLEFISKLYTDMAFQPRHLPAGTTVKITLVPNTSEKFFCMSSTAGNDMSLNIDDAVLEVHKFILSPALRIAHEQALMRGPALYPHTRSEIKSYGIASGLTGETIANVCLGTMPRRAIVAILPQEAYDGSYTLNPFNFKPNNLNYLSFSLNGKAYPHRPFTPDFENDIFTREFVSCFDSHNQLNTDSTMTIASKNYKDGYTLYGVNFSNNSSDGYYLSGYVEEQKKGNLNLELRFNSKLQSALVCLVFLEFDSMIEIYGDRTVRADYL